MFPGRCDQMGVIRHDDKGEQFKPLVLPAEAQALDDRIDVGCFDPQRQPIQHSDRTKVRKMFIGAVSSHARRLAGSSTRGKGFPLKSVRERILAPAIPGCVVCMRLHACGHDLSLPVVRLPVALAEPMCAAGDLSLDLLMGKLEIGKSCRVAAQ